MLSKKKNKKIGRKSGAICMGLMRRTRRCHTVVEATSQPRVPAVQRRAVSSKRAADHSASRRLSHVGFAGDAAFLAKQMLWKMKTSRCLCVVFQQYFLFFLGQITPSLPHLGCVGCLSPRTTEGRSVRYIYFVSTTLADPAGSSPGSREACKLD